MNQQLPQMYLMVGILPKPINIAKSSKTNAFSGTRKY